MRTTVQRAIGIDEATPGRVDYDPRHTNIPDMRHVRIPPRRGSIEAELLGEVGV